MKYDGSFDLFFALMLHGDPSCAEELTLYNWCILLRLTSGFVNPRTDVHRGEAEVNITFEGWLIQMLTEKISINFFYMTLFVFF